MTQATKTDSAARWLARAILTVLGLGALYAAFAFPIHNDGLLWPLVTTHHTTIGLGLLAVMLWLGVGGAACYVIYCLIKAAR